MAHQQSASLSGSASVVNESSQAAESAFAEPAENNGYISEDERHAGNNAAERKLKADMETKLRSWSATSTSQLNAVGTEREYKFAGPPDWKCVRCKTQIESGLVYQCQFGHLACHLCSMQGENCRKCFTAVSRIKNVAVENMMNSLLVTCKFANLGCKKVTELKTLKRSNHEDHCPFMPTVCPIPSCNQAGVRNLLAQHVQEKHKINRLVDVGKPSKYGGFNCEYEGHPTRKFDLKDSTDLVLLRNLASKEFYLLHLDSTAFGERLQVTSVRDSDKLRRYKLDVEAGEDMKYCFKSETTRNKQPGGGFVIPRQVDGSTLKKRCRVVLQTMMSEWKWYGLHASSRASERACSRFCLQSLQDDA